MALTQLSDALLLDEPLVAGEVSMVSQKELSCRVDRFHEQRLKESTTQTTDKARLVSLSSPHCGDWLQVVPCPALGLHMRDTE